MEHVRQAKVASNGISIYAKKVLKTWEVREKVGRPKVNQCRLAVTALELVSRLRRRLE
ncbi:MAG: hypothetical protein ACRD5J_12520 [Nitrososphaeraceae archaeon]